MPKIESLLIKNFKGAASVEIDLGRRNPSPITTLVGLNESGKTTLLEAISFFMTEDATASTLFQGIYSKSTFSNIIPLHLKAAFTGDISITAVIRLDDQDLSKINGLARELDLEVLESSIDEEMQVVTEYSFVDSVFSKRQFLYSFFPYVKKRKQKNYRLYVRPEDKSNDFWFKAVEYLKEELPQVVYFPTFLVNMPKAIYLKEHANETPINKCYRAVFDEVLAFSEPKLSIEQHVLKRIEAFRARLPGNSNWLSAFNASHEKSLIDSVMQRAANLLRERVIEDWAAVFSQRSEKRGVIVDWAVDTQREGIPYISLGISEGSERYYLSERSLGFRWFFSFLLFTAFRRARDKPTLFLFDEPAANLHAKAQVALLEQFQGIAQKGSKIVYSTHSHHMINPKWLSGAYIIENDSINFDSTSPFALNSNKTNIRATSYRNFVSQYPDRTSYFQPILESVEYVSPSLIGKSPFVLMEGITDYYAFRFFQEALSLNVTYSLIPGVGASALGPVISHLLGLAEEFVILLDDDDAGRKAAARYADGWHLQPERVRTLQSLDAKWVGYKLEQLIKDDFKKVVKNRLGIDKSPNKKQIGAFFSQLVASGDHLEKCDIAETANSFRVAIEAIQTFFAKA